MIKRLLAIAASFPPDFSYIGFIWFSHAYSQDCFLEKEDLDVEISNICWSARKCAGPVQTHRFIVAG